MSATVTYGNSVADAQHDYGDGTPSPRTVPDSWEYIAADRSERTTWIVYRDPGGDYALLSERAGTVRIGWYGAEYLGIRYR